jgi:hypothetical protein
LLAQPPPDPIAPLPRLLGQTIALVHRHGSIFFLNRRSRALLHGSEGFPMNVRSLPSLAILAAMFAATPQWRKPIHRVQNQIFRRSFLKQVRRLRIQLPSRVRWKQTRFSQNPNFRQTFPKPGSSSEAPRSTPPASQTCIRPLNVRKNSWW